MRCGYPKVVDAFMRPRVADMRHDGHAPEVCIHSKQPMSFLFTTGENDSKM
jgi:hypothetical protein